MGEVQETRHGEICLQASSLLLKRMRLTAQLTKTFTAALFDECSQMEHFYKL